MNQLNIWTCAFDLISTKLYLPHINNSKTVQSTEYETILVLLFDFLFIC